MSLLRQIAKHAAIIFLPEAFCWGLFALFTYITESAYSHGIMGKRTAQVVCGGFAVLYALNLIYYYFKLIQEKRRSHSQVYIVEMQPVRMPPFCEHFPRQATPT